MHGLVVAELELCSDYSDRSNLMVGLTRMS